MSLRPLQRAADGAVDDANSGESGTKAVGQVSASQLGAALAVRSSSAWWRRVSGRLSLAD
jgi:hypothetical protein